MASVARSHGGDGGAEPPHRGGVDCPARACLVSYLLHCIFVFMFNAFPKNDVYIYLYIIV